MTTLREILDDLRTWDHPEAQRFADEFESWAYGQERECPCQHLPELNDTCSVCHGTGTIREPGLVERLEHGDWRGASGVYAALREELGVEP